MFQLHLNRTQSTKILSFHDLCVSVVFKGKQDCKQILSAVNVNNLRACKLGRALTMMYVITSNPFLHFSSIRAWEMSNNNNMIKLPGIRTEYACEAFHFMGAKIYNALPLELRKVESY